jgi:hypothetical protein
MSARKRAMSARVNRRDGRRSRERLPSRSVRSNGERLQELFHWFLSDGRIFSSLRRHGNTSWQPLALVWLALCWGWSESRNLTDAFAGAVRQCRTLGFVSLSSYQGFMNALVVWTDSLLRVLWSVLHQRMELIGRQSWRITGWVPIAFDGSRSTAPRTESAEQALCAQNYGQGRTAKYRKKKTKGMRRTKNEKNKPQPQEPQLWITLLWHMGLRLPWMWRLGPSDSSERDHVLEMLETGEFPKNTLFCGDAGFVGYPLWSRIMARGHQFLVRVGANVSLLRELSCEPLQNGLVLCWPEAIRRAGLPPLYLRLVRTKIGKTKIWMLTSVCDSRKLTQPDMVRFYRLRWGIEVEFRGLKQTLDRARLRCRNHRRLFVEMNWSLLAMTIAELFALKEQLTPDRGPRTCAAGDPQKRSLAKTVRSLRMALLALRERPAPGEDLRTKLRLAVTDDYQRRSTKRARYRPRNPDKKPLGDPKIRKLTPLETRKLRELNARESAA